MEPGTTPHSAYEGGVLGGRDLSTAAVGFVIAVILSATSYATVLGALKPTAFFASVVAAAVGLAVLAASGG